MQNILSPRFILTFVLIGVASTAVSALLFGRTACWSGSVDFSPR